MGNNKNSAPRRYLGVMVSSTFTDLKEHRAALIKAIKGNGFTDIAMENDSAKPDVDVIDSSLQMVADASAYAAVISHKYGQTPISPDRNPDELSITELEFNEAQRLKRPILLFIMGDGHPVRKMDIETTPDKINKLNSFRERAKRLKPDSHVHRVYATFDSFEEFVVMAQQAVADLRRYLDKRPEEIENADPRITQFLNELDVLSNKLKEWKELHNLLQILYMNFARCRNHARALEDLQDSPMDRERKTSSLYIKEQFRPDWEPCQGMMIRLRSLAQGLQYIDHPYDPHKRTGPEWMIELGDTEEGLEGAFRDRDLYHLIDLSYQFSHLVDKHLVRADASVKSIAEKIDALRQGFHRGR